MALLAVRGALPPAGGVGGFDPRWVYAATVIVVGGLLAWFWRDYGELNTAQSRPPGSELALAVAVGIIVFALWIRLDRPWMTLGAPTATFSPLDAAGRIVWPLALMRWIGAALMVPVMEELFWRSFLMRWIEGAPFGAVVPQRVGLRAVLLSTFVFTLAHTLWLAAIVAGLAYAVLYRRTGRLWVPIVAHATTNGLLGVWVLATGSWSFW